MDWIQFISAVGIGAVIAKLLDIFLLEKMSRESERVRWIRDHKLDAFSLVSKELLSLGLNQEDQN